jgi:recombination protein RecT
MEESKEVAVVEEKNVAVKMFSEGNVQKALKNFLGNNPQAYMRFISSIRSCCARNPKILKCTKDSLINVFLNCAEWGLYPSVATGECYVIPYKNKKGELEAQFQLGYQGMVTLAYRNGITINAEIVYEKDRFEYEFGLNQKLIHVPDFFTDRGEPIGAYIVATLENDVKKIKIMNKDKIFEFRGKSQSYRSDVKYKSKNSPWQPENDPELNMWKKTCIKQIFKVLPKSPEMKESFEESEKNDIIDIKPEEKTVLDQSEVTGFCERMIEEGYDRDLIKRGIKEVLKRKSLEPLTIDEAAIFEGWLRAETNRLLDEKAAAQEGQGDLL